MASTSHILPTKFGDSCFSHSGNTIANIEIENSSCDLDHAPLWMVCYPKARIYLILSTSVQNLMILALAVPEISLGSSKFKVDHVPLTTPLLRVICHPYSYNGT